MHCQSDSNPSLCPNSPRLHPRSHLLQSRFPLQSRPLHPILLPAPPSAPVPTASSFPFRPSSLLSASLVPSSSQLSAFLVLWPQLRSHHPQALRRRPPSFPHP